MHSQAKFLKTKWKAWRQELFLEKEVSYLESKEISIL
jgi:hypothetical protein